MKVLDAEAGELKLGGASRSEPNMKLMQHHATGLPGAISQHSNRKSKSFIFFAVLLHGQEILTILIMFFPYSKVC